MTPPRAVRGRCRPCKPTRAAAAGAVRPSARPEGGIPHWRAGWRAPRSEHAVGGKSATFARPRARPRRVRPPWPRLARAPGRRGADPGAGSTQRRALYLAAVAAAAVTAATAAPVPAAAKEE
eukprot:gene36001-4193_t